MRFENPFPQNSDLKERKAPLHILNIRHSEEEARLIVRALKRGGYDPADEQVRSIEAVVSKLESHRYDVVICDYKLSKFSVLSVLKILKDRNIDTPLFVVSKDVGGKAVAQCLRSGAKDFILTGRLSELSSSVARAIEILNSGKKQHAEELLRASEERYRNILDDIQDGYYEIDLAGNFTFFNNAVCRIHGYSREELMGMNNRQYTDKTNAKIAHDAYAEIYETGKNGVLIGYEIIRKDKTRRQIEVTASLMRDAGGKPVGFRGVSRDITERRQMEEAVRKSEQRYRNILDGMQEAYFETDLQGKLIFFNNTLCRHLQYSREELVGADHRKYTDEATRKKVFEAFSRVYSTGEPIKALEEKIIRKDGSTGVSELSVALVRDVAGRPVGFAGVSRDVTDRKQMEEFLRQSEEKYRTIIETIQDGYLETNLKGQITFINHVISEQTGYGRDEILGKTSRLFQDETNYAKVSEALRRVFETGNPLKSLEVVSIRKDGIKGVFDISVSLIRDIQGKAIGFRGISRDMTERKNMEDALRASEKRYRTILEDIDEGYFEIDLKGRLAFVNDAICRDMGYNRPEELIGMDYRKTNDPSVIEKLKNIYAELYESGKPSARYETIFLRKDGSQRIAETTVFLMRNEDGRPIGYRGVSRDVTERVKAEEALRISEERYRGILENMQEAYFENDLHGFITFINDTACRHLGYSKEELIGAKSTLFLDEAGWKRTYQVYNELYKTGKPVKIFESEMVKKDGSRGVFELSVDLIRDSKGEPTGFRGISRDVTQRKRMEEAVRQSEEKYRNILENIEDGYGEIDLQGRITFFNDAFCRIHGGAADQLLGMSSADFLEEDHESRREIFQTYSRVYKTGEPIKEVAYTIRALDGLRKHLEASISLIRDKYNVPIGFRGLIRDVTERREIEDVIRQSEERYRTIIETIQDGYVEIDLNNNYTFVNDVVTEHWGYSREELIGMNARSIQEAESFRKTYQVFNEIYKTGRPVKSFELECIRKDKTIGSYEMSASLMRDAQGRPVGFRGISRDITERKRAEETLRQSNRDLEETTKRANEMAIQAQMASVAKSEFLANMSHEIRTPMNAVIGMTGLLLDTGLNEEQQRYAEIVRASGESLLGLINNILDFSKIEANKMDMEILQFDLLGLLEDFAGAMAVQSHEKGLELLCSLDPDVPTLLRGDPGRLRQVLSNLVGNAIKFTHVGEVDIRVSLREENEKFVLLRFSVRDTGIGIPESKINLLFDKFSQVDASTTRQYGGTGLGLVISRQLARLLGGDAGVESEEGKGSEFWFTARFGKQTSIAQKPNAVPANLSKVRVLIVDDNATNREILITRAISWDMRPSEASGGQQALDILRQGHKENDPFRLAVIDMQMPGMDGETLGRIIKTDALLSDIRMVLLTSLGSRGDARRLHEAGFEACVTKPVRHHELKSVLSVSLSERGVSDHKDSIVTRHAARASHRPFGGCNLRVLLAEDNITNQEVALGMLKKLGLRADTAANGGEALKALQSIPYDLVLMDVQMPEMDGFEATREIRRWGQGDEETGGNQSTEIKKRAAGIPVIAMTAHAMQGDRERCLNAGMNDYITKPISPQALVEALDRWLPCESEKQDRRPSELATSRDVIENIAHLPFFNREEFIERMMDDEEVAKQIAKVFLDDIPRQIGMLKDYRNEGNLSGVERQAHSIKGASANICAEMFRNLALEIEKAGKSGDTETIDARLPLLEAAFERLKTEMEMWLKNG